MLTLGTGFGGGGSWADEVEETYGTLFCGQLLSNEQLLTYSQLLVCTLNGKK
jgi:hypothetical protein